MNPLNEKAESSPLKNREPKRARGVYEKMPGSEVWWIRYADAMGRIRREKVGPKSAAIKLYNKRKTEALLGKKLPETLRRRTITFGELAGDALTYSRTHKRSHSDDANRMKRVLELFKDRAADSITPQEIERRLAGAGWSGATFNRVRALLSLTYSLAIRAGKVSINPARQVVRQPEGSPRQGFIADAQYCVLSRACPSLWLRTMLALGYTYGWRAGELIGLCVGQIDLTGRTIRLEPGTTKNREGRTVRLTRECLELVRACILGKEPGDPVFTYEDGLPVRAYRYGWEQLCVRTGLGRFVCRTCTCTGPATAATGRTCPACTKANRRGVFRYEGQLFHDLRRSAVRNLERAGVPRSVAMGMTGHKTESVYRRYAIVCEADLSEAVTRLERVRQLAPALTPLPLLSEAGSAKLN